tara:strand:- start:286 stop:915 length:630 start_codon:yes stop_codon:yes gene_type:complete
MSSPYDIINDCSCNGAIIPGVVQCRGCSNTYCQTCDPSGSYLDITQKRIWNTVRVPASEYTMNLGSLSVYQQPSTNPIYSGVNWNQMSDRSLPSNSNISKITVIPSRGNSTRSSITRNRPGSMRPGGIGVDIKHGSYDRYLARLKGKGPLRTQQPTTLGTEINNSSTQQQAQSIAMANNVYGNKTRKFGIVKSGPTTGSGKAGSCFCLF